MKQPSSPRLRVRSALHALVIGGLAVLLPLLFAWLLLLWLCAIVD
ncbi:MAG: hypothetical protein RB296_06630 [Acidobacteriota bacterium]|nr:hypothetical protein [Acidobacteriota bacterium]